MNTINHIAIIMDGNGRYAKQKGWNRSVGHKIGSENVKTIALHANAIGVKILTLYAFSSENWKRPENEKKYLFSLPKIFFARYLKELMDNGIKVSYIGDLKQFPKSMQEVILDACEKSRNNKGLLLCFALNYGSRNEIIRASQIYAKECIAKNELIELTEEKFTQYLYNSEIREVDLLIRTSNEQRVSNFLLWQISYSEFIFVKEHWPEFSCEVFDRCIEEYQKRHRRFGGL